MDIRILSSTMYHYTISTIHIVRLVFPYYKKTALAYHRREQSVDLINQLNLYTL